jgi:hypothetical protein
MQYMTMQPEDVERLHGPDHLGLALADNLAQCIDEPHKLEVLTAWLEEHEGKVDRAEALVMDSFLTHADMRQKFYRALNRTHPSGE